MLPIIGRGFVTLKLRQFKRRTEVWVAEVCDPCPIGLDLFTAGGWAIDLGWGVLLVGFEELPFGGVSTDERVELKGSRSRDDPPGHRGNGPGTMTGSPDLARALWSD